MRHRAVRRLLTVLMLALFAAPAAATVYVPVDFQQMVNGATYILHGRIADVRSEPTADRSAIVTYVTLDVEEPLKGRPGESVVFRVPGGQVGRYRRIVVGAPQFNRGDEVILFLSTRGPSIPYLFGLIFTGIGAFSVVSAFVNSRIVERLGTRVVSHTALLSIIGISGLHLLIIGSGRETLGSFMVLQGLTAFCSVMAAPNFGAMAMQPMGHIAGTAASTQGFLIFAGAAAIGIAISQSFDGTPVAIVAGFLIMSVTALIVVLITEQGRLFQPHASPADADLDLARKPDLRAS